MRSVTLRLEPEAAETLRRLARGMKCTQAEVVATALVALQVNCIAAYQRATERAQKRTAR